MLSIRSLLVRVESIFPSTFEHNEFLLSSFEHNEFLLSSFEHNEFLLNWNRIGSLVSSLPFLRKLE